MTTMQADDVPGDVDARVGKRVHSLMWDRHLTQTAVASHLRIEQSAFSRKLRGSRGWSLRELIIVAKVLRTTTAYLLGETDDDRPADPEPDGDGGARHPSQLGATPTGQYGDLPVVWLPDLPEQWLAVAQSNPRLAPNLTRASLDRAA